MFIKGDYSTYFEDFKFDGNYDIEENYLDKNTVDPIVDYDSDEALYVYPNKAEYNTGTILYKTNEPEIKSMIDMLIRSTYRKNTTEGVDHSVYNEIFVDKGDLCPSVIDIFTYKGKTFTLYGRYIYNYLDGNIEFRPTGMKEPKKDKEEYKEDDEDYEEEEKVCVLSKNYITLATPGNGEHEYCYAMKIVDENGILLCFGIYP